MKTSIIIVLLCLAPHLNLINAQNVGINTTGVAPDASSILDVSATDKGILIPRVNIIDLTTAAPITVPSNSLLVYNTNITSGVGFYFWNGTEWINLTDNSGNADEDWYEVGTTSDPDNINNNVFTMGNVGIGTTTPTNNLHVSGGTESGSIKIEADTDGNADTDQAYILLDQDGGTVQAHIGFGSTEANGDVFRIGLRGGIIPSIDYNTFIINAQTKRVGIGTSTPNKPLSVFGTGSPASMTGGGPWANFSDSTLKKNITAYNEGLSLIMKIKPHNYSYNREYETIFGGGKSLNNHIYQGIIAQELREIAPDMVEEISIPVYENDNEVIKTFLQVSTNKFTYALINATKEQQALIEQQAIIISDLEQRLKTIEELLKK